MNGGVPLHFTVCRPHTLSRALPILLCKMVRPAAIAPAPKSPAKHNKKAVAPKAVKKAIAHNIKSVSARRRLLDENPTRAVSARQLRFLGLQAGLGTFQSDARDEMRRVMHNNAQEILNTAVECAHYEGKKTLTSSAIEYAYKVLTGNTLLIGYGDDKKQSDVQKYINKALHAGRHGGSKKKGAETSDAAAAAAAVDQY